MEYRSKPVIFSMARLDKVKNITGLVEWYGQNKRLRDLANLVVVGGLLDPSQSKDREEIEGDKQDAQFDQQVPAQGANPLDKSPDGPYAQRGTLPLHIRYQGSLCSGI